MRFRRLFVAIVAVAVVVPGAAALAQASATPGPVSPTVIGLVNSAGTLFQIASPDAHPRVSKRSAIRDALREAPWRHMTATGISLIRLAQPAIDARAGSLAWLVSVEPVSAGTPATGGPAPTGAQTLPPGNYFVVAVTASNGRFIAAAHGYTSPSPAQ